MWILFGISAAIVGVGLGRWIYKDLDTIRAYRDRLDTAERETRR